MDEKYDLLKHPNVVFTTDGKGKPYEHGGTENAVATISFTDASQAQLPEPEALETEYNHTSEAVWGCPHHFRSKVGRIFTGHHPRRRSTWELQNRHIFQICSMQNLRIKITQSKGEIYYDFQ